MTEMLLEDFFETEYAQRVARRLQGITCAQCKHYAGDRSQSGSGTCTLMKRLFKSPMYPVNDYMEAKGDTCLWFSDVKESGS